MRSALFLGMLGCLLSACGYDNGDAHRVSTDEPSASCDDSPTTPVQTWIDTDGKIPTDPGQSAGVFVEYAAGGHWRLLTTCDSVNSGTPCAWDIIVTPEDTRSISNVAPVDSEAGSDSVGPYLDDPASYQLVAETSNDLDGMTFDTQPGTAVMVDAFLDGKCALPYFFWVGDGAAHTGSPSNPLVLIPTTK